LDKYKATSWTSRTYIDYPKKVALFGPQRVFVFVGIFSYLPLVYDCREGGFYKESMGVIFCLPINEPCLNLYAYKLPHIKTNMNPGYPVYSLHVSIEATVDNFFYLQ
jgi:hypothetical protein